MAIKMFAIKVEDRIQILCFIEGPVHKSFILASVKETDEVRLSFMYLRPRRSCWMDINSTELTRRFSYYRCHYTKFNRNPVRNFIGETLAETGTSSLLRRLFTNIEQRKHKHQN